MVLFSEAPGPEIEKQAVGRIYRYGQGRWVRVERFYMKTANAQLRLAKYLLRAIPAIMADLNLELYGDKEESGVINLGRFCRVGEKLVPADSAEAQGLKPLEADEVLMFIQRQLTGMVGAFEKP